MKKFANSSYDNVPIEDLLLPLPGLDDLSGVTQGFLHSENLLKFIDDICFLNNNLVLFKSQIDNKNNRKQYESKHDYQNKVIRTKNNFCYSVNYDNSYEGLVTIKNILGTFKEMFGWGKFVRGLISLVEARNNIQDTISLGLLEFYTPFIQSDTTVEIVQLKTIIRSIPDNLTLPVEYLPYLKKFCSLGNINFVFYSGILLKVRSKEFSDAAQKAKGNVTVELNTPNLYHGYMTFCDKSIYQRLTEKGLYHFFTDHQTAEEFCQWLKEQDELKSSLVTQVLQPRHQLFSKTYDVVLNATQFNIIMGIGCYERLFDEPTIIKNRAQLLDLKEFEHQGRRSEIAAFEEELNKRRLLVHSGKEDILANWIDAGIRGEKIVEYLGYKIRHPGAPGVISQWLLQMNYRPKTEEAKSLFIKFLLPQASPECLSEIFKISYYQNLWGDLFPEIAIMILGKLDVETFNITINNPAAKKLLVDFNIFDEKLKHKVILESAILNDVINDAMDNMISQATESLEEWAQNNLQVYLSVKSKHGKLNTKEKKFYEFHQDTSDRGRDAQNSIVNNDSYIVLSNMEQIPLKDVEDQAEKIFYYGFNSFIDIILVRNNLRQKLINVAADRHHSFHLAFIYETLKLENALLRGARFSYTEFLNFPGVMDRLNTYIAIYNCIQHGNSIIKIIKAINFADFLHQLKDYNYRPKLRRDIPEITSPVTGLSLYKYLHNEDKIISFVSHKGIKNKIYEALKKQSFTYLSHHLDTQVFGEGAKRTLVGLLFDQEASLPIKAFFKHDFGTVARNWVGTLENIKDYQKRVANVRMSSLEETREHTDKNRAVMTELFSRVTREALLAIIIAEDSNPARVQAREWQILISQELNIILPIIFYNRRKQAIEFLMDKPLFSVINAKSALTKIIKDITPKMGFLDKKHVNDPSLKLLNKFSQLMNQGVQEEQTRPEIWVNMLAEAEKILASQIPAKPNTIAKLFIKKREVI
jgi:hypothetical protein